MPHRRLAFTGMRALHAAVITIPLLLAAFAADGQSTAPAPASLSPEAARLLRRMADTLAAARSLTVEVDTLREVPLADGRIVTLGASSQVALRRPDRLRADVRGDATLADIHYDGRRVVVHAVAQNAWAETAAPPDIDSAIALLRDRLGLPLEVGSLLVADPYARLAEGTTGEVVSDSVIDGIPVDHLVLQSGPIAWEIWLADTELGLPVLASVRRDGNRMLLRFVSWRIDPRLPDARFSFAPPRGARQVPFVFRQEGP